MVVFYLFTIGSFFDLDIYYLEDRTTIHDVFSRHVISKQVDELVLFCTFGFLIVLSIKQRNIRLILGIALISLLGLGFVFSFNIITYVSLTSIPIIGSIFLIHKYFPKDVVSIELGSLFLNYLCLGIIILGLVSIVLSLVSLRSDQGISARDYFIESFILLSRFSPLLMFLLIFSVPLRTILVQVASRLKQTRVFNFQRVPEQQTKLSFKLVSLSLCVLFSVAIALVPHLSPEARVIGVDTIYYVNWIRELDETETASEFINQLFAGISFGDRPIAIFLLYLLAKLYVAADLVSYLEYVVPIILAPSLSISIYFLTRELTRNDGVAILAAFMTAVSFQVIIGIYAAFYANWISLIFAYFCLVFLLRGLRKPSKLNYIFFTSILLVVLVTHVYTYTVFAIFISIFLVTMHFLKKYSKRVIVMFLVITASTVALDVLRSVNNPSLGGIERDLGVAQTTGSGLAQFGYRWDNLVRTVQVFLGGAYGNILLVGLAVYASVGLNSKTSYAVFISIFLSLGILPLFFANRDLMSRVLYDIPFQVPAAFSLFWITQRTKFNISFVFPAILISLIAIAVYMLTNI